MQIDASYTLLMAQYNEWMNAKLYSAAAKLDQQQLRADCGIFFKSIFATLNHLLVVDLLWLARFAQQQTSALALNSELYADFATLHQARQHTDRDILNWARELKISPTLSYARLADNNLCTIDYGVAIVHFFNHQTHHRGQLSAALAQQGIDIGVTDLIHVPR